MYARDARAQQAGGSDNGVYRNPEELHLSTRGVINMNNERK